MGERDQFGKSSSMPDKFPETRDISSVLYFRSLLFVYSSENIRIKSINNMKDKTVKTNN